MGFGDFVGLLGTAGPPVPLVPLAFVFLVFCGGFKGPPPPQTSLSAFRLVLRYANHPVYAYANASAFSMPLLTPAMPLLIPMPLPMLTPVPRLSLNYPDCFALPPIL